MLPLGLWQELLDRLSLQRTNYVMTTKSVVLQSIQVCLVLRHIISPVKGSIVARRLVNGVIGVLNLLVVVL